MSEVVDHIWINAPMEAVYAVVTDFERYADIIPEVTSITVHQHTDATASATLAIEVIKRLEYTLDFTLEYPYRVNWTLRQGDGLTKNTGEWWLQEEEGGTTAIYTIDLEFGFPVPGMIKTKLIEASLPTMLGRVKKTTEARADQASE